MQLLLNAINDEAIVKMARVSYEAFRHAAVLQEDYTNPPWMDLSHPQRKEWINKVRAQLHQNFPKPDDGDAMGWLHRTVVLSMLSLWSGSPQMGPQVPPLPYEKPEPEPEPEAAKEDPKPKKREQDGHVDVSSEDEVDEETGGESSTEDAGGAEETSDESSEDSTPKPSSKSRKK